MKFQMHRVLLVNAGSNKSIPSARLTEIDPRDGAAVLGANGVGKTTVLQIIPLFFGHLPSQIVGAGQQNMISFLLPTDGSAIGFEFQRGAEAPENMRLVVMRRRNDDPDVGFYRIFTSPFNKDLFVQDGRFLNDEESVKRAGELGIKHTKMLTTSEYRSVILRTTATSKDRDKLRLLAYENSFGPRPLDNLDRLVAAMVKPAINFEDILQVVVSMVQREQGQGAEKSRITFKQPPSLIKRWLANRVACIAAEGIRPKMVALEADLTEHRHAESRFRSRRSDVNAVIAARVDENAALTVEIADLDAQKTSLADGQRAQRLSLAEASASAQSAVTTGKLAFDVAKATADNFESERAQHWTNRMVELGGFQDQERSLRAQIKAAEAGQAEAAATYLRLDQDARSDAQGQETALMKLKQPVAEKLQADQAAIQGVENATLEDADAICAGVVDHCQAATELLLVSRGQWQMRKSQPGVSNEAREAKDAAEKKRSAHKDNLSVAQAAVTKAQQAAGSARRELDEHETSIKRAKDGLSNAEASLVAAKARLSPPPGSLLAALRGSEDQSWKRNLAKIIRHDLLDRTDLNPELLEDQFRNHAFGWSMDTGVIESPEWVDDQRTKDAVAGAEVKVGAAKAFLESLNSVWEAKSKADQQAKAAFTLEEAKLSVLQGQSASLNTAWDAACQAVEAELKTGVADAERELQKLNVQITELKSQQDGAKRKLDADRKSTKALHERQRADAKGEHDAAIRAIDAQIAANVASLSERIAGIKRQQDEHLSANGIDVKKLGELRLSLSQATIEVNVLQEKKVLVDRWKKWQEEGGGARLDGLQTALQRAHDLARTRLEEKNRFESQAAAATAQIDQSFESRVKRQGCVVDDISELRKLDKDFGDYQAVGESLIDLKIEASELRGKTRAERDFIDKLEDKILKSFKSQRNTLTNGNSAVGELVEASLSLADSSTIAMAADLCITYKQIGRQVVSNLNTTLDAILDNVYQFQKTIRTFEADVSAFNTKLQKGLTAVHKFERISRITLLIKTNFESLNFYKKFSTMEGVIRDHNNVAVKNPDTYIPPEEIALALSEFAYLLDKGGDVDVSLARFISLQGEVTENERTKTFRNAAEFANVSSSGLTALVSITVMTALLNTIRGEDPIYVPWVTDEIGKYDVNNLGSLIGMLCENKIDVITASPDLTYEKLPFFARRYLLEDKGRIRKYVKPKPVVSESDVAYVDEKADA